MPSPSERPLVVLVSGVGWDGVKGSERQLAESLGRYVDVLWVDHPVSPLTPPRYRGVESTPRAWWPRSDRVAPGVVRLRPVALPFHSRPAVRWSTWPLVRAQIRAALRASGRRPHAVIAASFDDVLGHWGDDVVDVLYGTDDWVAAADLMGQPVERLRREERAALAKADVVLAVSPELVDRWATMVDEPVLFPNGCDPSAFDGVDNSDLGLRMRSLPAVVAGVVGQLTDRIDIGYLEAVADEGLGLLLVGPRDPRWAPDRAERLLARPNVHHTGAVPFSALPRWLACMDVGLVPYSDTPFNRASFPLKSLEYLAAGLPVVSTDLPAIRRLGADPADIQIETDRRRFAVAAARCTGPGTDRLGTARRRSVARAHSWDERAQHLGRLLKLEHGESGPVLPASSGVGSS